MSGSIMDSSWMRLLEKNHERPAGYKVDTTDDTYPELEKAEAELASEIQTERLARMKNSKQN
jgi:hypothetical protein